MRSKRRYALLAAAALCSVAGLAGETLRGRFSVDLEPVYALEPGVPYPLDAATAHRRVLDEASRTFAAIIYGWSFEYALGDRARGIAERFDLEPLGAIPFGDPRLSVTDAGSDPSILHVWSEYRLDNDQARAAAVVREGTARRAQGTGSAPLSGGTAGKEAALRDAARTAVRAVLGGSERNRPKEAYGTVSLEDVPRYWVDEGRFICSARFRVNVKRVVPYAYF